MLAWLYWNPPRELFTIPFIDRPIAIYGACFVLGFILSFFILCRIFKYKFLAAPTLRMRDISDWQLLIQQLQAAQPGHPLACLAKLKLRRELNTALKQEILDGINGCKLSRKTLEELFPKALVTARETGLLLTDKLVWFVVLATIVGARLGHVFFYEWPRYQDNWIAIFKVWEGGLASHGGIIAILFALYLYYRLILKHYPEITFIGLIDAMAVPAPLAAAWIRVGNFFNQEILGPATTMPWGIIFGDPMDGGPIEPRHATPLYEAGAYFILFGLMYYLWQKKRDGLQPGILSGLCLTLGFSFRFLIEYIKLPQSMLIDESFLQMGQYLSLPFILLGCVLLCYGQQLNKSFTQSPQ